MHCRNCGSEVTSINTPCQKCGFLPLNGRLYCQECGYETKEGQEICINCNTRLRYAASPSSNSYNNSYNQYEPRQNNVVDEPNTFANLSACCSIPFTGGLPIVGLIIYILWKDEKPNAARSVCIWSIAPFIACIIIYIIVFILTFTTSFFNY